MESLKFAIVGCGNIGKRHLSAITQESSAELVAICDNDPQVTSAIKADHANVQIFNDYEEMLQKADFDVLSICTPHGLHASMGVQAARNKKHILVEKPMALNVRDSDKMIEVAREEGVRLFVVKQNRFNQPVFAVKKALDEKALGRIFMVQCNVFWNRNEDYYKASSWRGKRQLEGGALFTQVSHFLDLLIWWFGGIAEAKTMMDTLNHDIEFEDCGVSGFRLENGILGTLNWTTCVYNKNYEGSITIIGEKGTVKIGGKYLNKIEFWDVQSYPCPDETEEKAKPNVYGGYQGSSSNHDRLMTTLVEAILHKRKGLVEGLEGKRLIEAIEKIYQS